MERIAAFIREITQRAADPPGTMSAMNYAEFRANWSDWHAGRLDAETAKRMAQQCARCAQCQRYDQQMRRMLASLAELPLPDDLPAEPVLTAPRVEQTRPPRSPAPWWLAAAAAVVVAFGAGVLTHALLDDAPGEPGAMVAEGVEVEPGAEREIQLAVSSRRSLDAVEFEIELPPDVELEGYPGQRVVRWQGHLAEGRSRLTLPLRIGTTDEDAEVLARIRHVDGEREIRIPLRTRSPGNGSA